MTIVTAALTAALDLTKQGFACFPVGANKHPTIPKGKGFYAASTDPHVVRDLFRRYAGPLVGVATGTISNIDLLDIDQKPEARQWWAENRHRMPPTRAHRTRSGGFVWCFSTPPACGIPPLTPPAASIPEAMGGTASGGPPQGSRCCPTTPPAPWPDWLLAQALPPPLPVAPVAVVSDGKLIRGILTVVARAVVNELDYLGLRAIRRRVKDLEAQGERSKKGSTRSENTTSFCEIRLRATRAPQ